MKKTPDPLPMDDDSPPPKLGLEAAIAGLRMFLKDGFDLRFERFARQSPSLFGFLSLFWSYPVARGNQAS
ncbi:hypothetical protein [Hydrogenibacillus sp. N12]|uniref:hypothetical protein n=1 Tax=Hydrogenibacillus sp. N12 TaxID=2866627 RepID=UPI00207BF6E2|nr:hypothetical protein [Hydrogenibacillus sp. N12]